MIQFQVGVVSTVDTLTTIYDTISGWRGFYRGAVPNAQRAAVVNGVQIPAYDVTKRNLLSHGYTVSFIDQSIR